MEQLSVQDLRLVVECLQTLQVVCTLPELPTHLLNLLAQLVGAEVSFCSSFADRCNTLEITPAEVRTLHIEPGYFQQNPLIQNYFQTQDGSAYKISDFLSQQELYQQESLYEGHLRILGVVDQLAMVIPEPSNLGPTNSYNRIPRQHINPTEVASIAEATTLGRLAIGFYRTTRSFSERDRAILNLIRPHLAHAYHNAQMYTELQHQLGQLNHAVNQLGSVILSLTGRIQLLSPRALQLVEQYFPGSSWFGDQLPEPLQTWVSEQIQRRYQSAIEQPEKPLQIEQIDRCLRIRLLGSAASRQFLLTLEEHQTGRFSVETLRRIGLTKRESEVLIQVARGKTNAEIATELVVSQKTVNKHLENLSKKLNVQTRAAAVTKALEQLGIME